jgi:hypothetical protein
MRYQVSGADRESGKPADRVIEAPDESDARAQASSSGLMIETLAVLPGGGGGNGGGGETTGPYAVRVLSTAVEHGQDSASILRARLESMLNTLAGDGWEFVSVQSVPALTIAGHHGRGRITAENVPADVCLAVFRRGQPTTTTTTTSPQA